MKKYMLKTTHWTTVSIALIFLFACATMAADPATMTKETLLQQLDNPQLVILDVRTGKDWKSSELKIKGAVYADPRKFKEWSVKYPKDKTLVLYCA